MENVIVVGLCGISRSGKSSIRKKFIEDYSLIKENVFCFDNYLKGPIKKYDELLKKEIEDWEDINCYDTNKLYNDLVKRILEVNKFSSIQESEVLMLNKKIVFIEGFLIYSLKEISDLIDYKFIINTDFEKIKERRRKTKNYQANDFEYYFYNYILKVYNESK